MQPTDDLDTLIRRVDQDRWLATRFAQPDARRRLIALYALNYELARSAEVVRDPRLGDLRLAWWREALEKSSGSADGAAHPVLAAFEDAQRETPFSSELIEAMLEARRKDLDSEPFASWAELEDYVAATAGGLMRLAAQACAQEVTPAVDEFIRRAGLAWGEVGLLRAEPVWRARGRRLLPLEGGSLDLLAERARDAYRRLQVMARPSAELFPAVGYVALAPAYLAALRKEDREAPLLLRQLKIVAAAATGRI